MRKLNTEQFIQQAKKIHGDEYSYSKAEYVSMKTPVYITCPKHGDFWQTPEKHIGRKHGCPLCRPEKLHDVFVSNGQAFIEKAKNIHGSKYDYSKVNYINAKTKVCIICPEHGEFWQTPDHHLNSIGCLKCKNIIKGLHHRKSFGQFKKEAAAKHRGKYSYPCQSLEGIYDRLKIICPKHGEFIQTAHSHLRGAGCPFCYSSRGEKTIQGFLDENNIKFDSQYSFEELKVERVLRYDFYVPGKNLLIEYNGRQHYEPVEKFGGKENLKQQRHRDWLKRKYARDHGIRLLTIPYTQFNMIEEILKENILCQLPTQESGLHSD